jgi:hypothetical protein
MTAFAVATLLVCSLTTCLLYGGAQCRRSPAAAITVGALVAEATNAAKKRLRFDLAQCSFLD